MVMFYMGVSLAMALYIAVTLHGRMAGERKDSGEDLRTCDADLLAPLV
jgi:hypothetical protein